jgi:hypothetical protein
MLREHGQNSSAREQELVSALDDQKRKQEVVERQMIAEEAEHKARKEADDLVWRQKVRSYLIGHFISVACHLESLSLSLHQVLRHRISADKDSELNACARDLMTGFCTACDLGNVPVIFIRRESGSCSLNAVSM